MNVAPLRPDDYSLRIVEIFEQTVFGNPLKLWSQAITATLLVIVIFKIVQRLVVARLRILTQRSATQYDDAVVEALAETRFFFILAWAIFIGMRFLSPSPSVLLTARHILVIVTVIQAAIWGSYIITRVLEHQMRQKAQTDLASATTLGMVTIIAKMVFFILLALLGMNNLGVDITALVAGLGVGGIAIALAVQNILGDLFASLTIVLDKPFIVGDFIIVGEQKGTIERIGLKTTRVRSLTGEQLIFSNADLLQSRIHNYKRMNERRVVFQLGVTYETPHDKLQKIPGILREIIEGTKLTRFDRSHFSSFLDFSLNFETVYWVLAAEFNEYAKVENSINLEIYRRFQAEGIDFAYPTRTLYMNQVKSGDPSDAANSPLNSRPSTHSV